MTRRVSPRAGFDLDAETWRLSDFLFFFLLPMAALQVWGFPVPELAMLAAVCLAASRRIRAHPQGWLPGLLLLFLVWMGITASLNDLTPYRRLLHLLLYCVVVLFLAQGRFSMRSVGRGLAAGLVVAAGLALVGIGSTGYAGRLTGAFGDPNLAGFYLTTLGAVAAAHLSSRRIRLVFLVIVTVLVLLTLSRTSILTIGLVGIWILCRKRLPPVTAIALIACLLYGVSRYIERLRLFGPFAERAGSDALRDRIVALEKVQISQHHWLGNGPGTSTVSVDGAPFYFHNSYLALQNEGGWLAIALFMAVALLAFFNLARLPQAARNPWLEGGFVAAATCAANLGEVLLELPTAVVIGAGVWHVLKKQDGASQAVETPPDTALRHGTRVKR